MIFYKINFLYYEWLLRMHTYVGQLIAGLHLVSGLFWPRFRITGGVGGFYYQGVTSGLLFLFRTASSIWNAADRGEVSLGELP